MAASTWRPLRWPSRQAPPFLSRERRFTATLVVRRRGFRHCETQLRDREELKAAAADRALNEVQAGMIVGLGTGTTARYFIEGLGRRVALGLDVRVVASSRSSADLARSFGIRIVDELDAPIDLAVDGADEIDPSLQLVKGRGGALVREKLVAAAARRFVIIADGSKLVSKLGQGPLPVEILPFLWRQTKARLEATGPRC